MTNAKIFVFSLIRIGFRKRNFVVSFFTVLPPFVFSDNTFSPTARNGWLGVSQTAYGAVGLISAVRSASYYQDGRTGPRLTPDAGISGHAFGKGIIIPPAR